MLLLSLQQLLLLQLLLLHLLLLLQLMLLQLRLLLRCNQWQRIAHLLGRLWHLLLWVLLLCAEACCSSTQLSGIPAVRSSAITATAFIGS